jgi:hypothetical protein
MDPATVSLVITALVKYGPEVYVQIRKMLAGPVSDADWQALDAILERTGQSYFPGLRPKVTQ